MLRGLFYLLSMTGIPRLIFRLMLDRRVPLRLKLLLPAAIAYIILANRPCARTSYRGAWADSTTCWCLW